jgi:hypothetical protein
VNLAWRRNDGKSKNSNNVYSSSGSSNRNSNDFYNSSSSTHINDGGSD